MMARINPAGLAQLQARLTPRAVRAAQAAAEVLKVKLSGGGSGVQYFGLPNRSSSENEYPAEQSGDLAKSIQARASPGRPGFAEFGSIDGPAYAAVLHFKPPDAGGRPFMNDAQHDRDIHAAILESMKGGA
jgi:hypothetical protein